MTASELRLGNWYYVKTITGEWREEQLKRGANLDALDGCSIDEAKPIPLTEEWLLKFGFDEVDGNQFYKFFDLGDFRVFIHNEGDSVFVHWKGERIEPYTNNFYIHSFQNLYFALINEELKLKDE